VLLAEDLGRHERACVLAGAVAAIFEQNRSWQDRSERAGLEQAVMRLRNKVDPEIFTEATARGRAQTIEGAVNLALQI
jgi:hypothetical protein